jgi:hypothetical protein
LRGWVAQAEVDSGARPGTTTDDKQRIKELERENSELRRYYSPGLLLTGLAVAHLGFLSSGTQCGSSPRPGR